MFFIGNLKIPHRVIMAPMCGITYLPFRKLVKSYGAGLVMTQMVSSKALTMKDEKTRFILDYEEDERPIAFQVFGKDPDILAESAAIAQEMGCDMVDLNMGCPAKKIVNDGGGAALLKNRELSKKIFVKMRSVLKIPFTIKMRAGWDQHQGEALELAQIAQECGVDAVTLHARTRAQGYSGNADWNLIKEFKQNLKIPVIGNGDITHFSQIDPLLKETGCDAVMIGRGAVSQPWFFKSYHLNQDYIPSLEETRELIFKQYESYFDFFGQENGIKQMRKHICVYTKGISRGANFRNQIIRLTDFSDIKNSINEFFQSQNNLEVL